MKSSVELVPPPPRRGLLVWLGGQAKGAFLLLKKLLGFAAPGSRDRVETEFLPAALEVVETPPSPVGRALGTVVVLIFCVGLAWALFGKIDIVATAPGKIIVHGGDKVIQSLEPGGQGHPCATASRSRPATLIELDPTSNAADVTHLRNDLAGAQVDVARLRASLTEEVATRRRSSRPKGVEPAFLETAPAAREPGHRAEIQPPHSTGSANRRTPSASPSARRSKSSRRRSR
jgi:hypothetical protein